MGLVVRAGPHGRRRLRQYREPPRLHFTNWGSVVIAVAITLYFFRQNLIGIHESSDKALKIMYATTVMAVVILVWCGVTLYVRGGPVNDLPWKPDLRPKVEYKEIKTEGVDRLSGQKDLTTWVKDPATGRLVTEKLTDEQGREVKDEYGNSIDKPKINDATHKQEDPLGLIARWFPGLAARLRGNWSWISAIGFIGVLLAFGHSILAMSGEETLAQVYREVESPKMKNFKKAAFVVFLYSLLLTGGISFLAVMLIPDEVRMKLYQDNLIGGLAMYMVGPLWCRLALNVFVVVVGFLILAGAVNTAIIGSNGVLNRVAEDGVLPDWFLKPHRALRHDLPHPGAGRGAATADDPAQPRRHVRAGRGVCLRRGVELRVQGPGDDRAAVHATAPARFQGAAELPRLRRGDTARLDHCCS